MSRAKEATHLPVFTRSAGIYETDVECWTGGLDPIDHDPTTARVWTIHMPYRTSDAGSIPACMDLLMSDSIDREVLGIPHVLGYLAGDDWVEWCEPRQEGNFAALHAYFEATPENAAALGLALARVLGVQDVHAVTTAGDWAEAVA
jgi:hypothetical protein